MFTPVGYQPGYNCLFKIVDLIYPLPSVDTVDYILCDIQDSCSIHGIQKLAKEYGSLTMKAKRTQFLILN